MILKQEHVKCIKELKPMEVGFIYKTSAWKALSEERKALVKEFEEEKVKRKDIIQAYQEYFSKGGNVLKPFLLTMIWGYADTGYGNYRTNKYLKPKDGTNQVPTIEKAINAAKEHKLEDAFNMLNQISGLSISFISKVLYFADKAANPKKEYALVFDMRVASSLIKLTTPKEVFDIVTVYPSAKYDDYAKYIALIHQLAKTNNLEADAIEMFLFDYDKIEKLKLRPHVR